VDSRISKVLDYIEANLSEDWSLNRLADVACMSPGYFHRKFKEETGRTPFQFAEEILMNVALRQIASGRFKVHELSAQLGYNDYETFNRAFKKHFQLAPDDMKAIALKVMKLANVDENALIIKPMEVEDEAQLARILESDEIKKLILERGFTEADLKDAEIIGIRPKETDDKEDRLVKNKFFVMEDRKEWKNILKQTLNGE
jgi:AraC-like DNA-binding protein